MGGAGFGSRRRLCTKPRAAVGGIAFGGRSSQHRGAVAPICAFPPARKFDGAMMTYDEHDVLLHVGPRAFEAGRIYQQQRRVLQYENGGD